MATDQLVRNPGRRWFVTKFASRTAWAGLGALTVGRLVGRDGVTARAANGDPLIIGQDNSSSSSTSLTSSSYPALVAYTNSTSGTGVIGHATASSGEITGVTGASDSPDGVGVFGIITTASPGTGTAVVGYTNSPTGRGVNGNAASPTGQTIGVSGGAASPDGIGVLGTNSNGGPGVKGVGNTGVQGVGIKGGTGVVAETDTGSGVFALSRSGTGVYGVISQGDFGIGGVNLKSGVLGLQNSPDGSGVLAIALPPGGTALKVLGKAKFSTVGAGMIAAGASSATVPNADVTATSHITVTLTDDPGKAPGHGGPPIRAAVDWVERNPGVGFTVHLTRMTAKNTPFTFLIIEPS